MSGDGNYEGNIQMQKFDASMKLKKVRSDYTFKFNHSDYNKVIFPEKVKAYFKMEDIVKYVNNLNNNKINSEYDFAKISVKD